MDNYAQKTNILGVVQLLRPTSTDDRGFLREPVRIRELEEASGIPFQVAQMNHARSIKNTLRGIHTAPWNKLIYVPRGKVQSVIIDLRANSQTFGMHQSFIIGDENRSSIFVPKGCGNSYLVLSEDADYTYLTDQEWEPNKETGIAWNDKELDIAWQIDGTPLLSEKDQFNPTFKETYPDR